MPVFAFVQQVIFTIDGYGLLVYGVVLRRLKQPDTRHRILGSDCPTMYD